MRQTLPQNLRKSEGTPIDDFQTIGNWVARYGSREVDPVYYKQGTQGIKITNTTAGENRAAITRSGLNLSLVGKSQIAMWLYVHDRAKLDNFRVYLYSSASAYFQATIAGQDLDQGWNWVVLQRADFITWNGATWDTIIKLTFQLSAHSGQVASMTFAGLYSDPVMLPRVVIGFDDCYASVHDIALPMFQAAGIRGVMYLSTDFVKSNPAVFLSEAKVEALYSAGWDISIHTKGHIRLTDVSDAEVVEQVNGCRNWILDRGYVRGANHMSYPFGSHSQRVVDIVNDLGFVTARTVRSTTAQYNQPNNRLTIPIKMTLTYNTTIASVQAAVDSALTTNGTIIFYGHSIATDAGTSDTTTPTAVLQALVDRCVQRKAQVVTMSEWWDQLSNPRKLVTR